MHEAPEIRQDRLAQSAVDAPRRIVIHNSYLTAQHVFLDSQAIGLVPQAAERSFDVPEGAHFPTLSDSPDGPSNVQYVGEVFERGFEYRYEVVAR